MISFNQLFEQDKSLEIVFLKGDSNTSFSTLTRADRPLDNSIIMVKDKSFYKKFLESFNNAKDHDKEKFQKINLLIQKDFYEKDISSQAKTIDIAFLKENISGLMIVKNIDHFMSYTSKVFYLDKMQGALLYQDGRDKNLKKGKAEIDESAIISSNVFIGEHVRIGKNVIIHANVEILAHSCIGDDTEIFPHVSIYPFVKIGERCRIHSGVRIGVDGFGYNFFNGVHNKVWHFGGVEIGNDVEIGANSAVDTGTFAPTRVGNGSKIDNFVQVAHNCQVGRGVILCGAVGLAGSCTIGDYSVLGGRASVTNNVVLGKGCQVAGMSGVSSDWPDGSVIAGHPARKLKEWLKGVAYLRKHSLGGSKEEV